MIEGMIDITGADLTELVKAAYALSRPQGMGFMHFREGELTDAQAKAIVDVTGTRYPVSMDYVFGRAVKLTVFREGDKLLMRDKWFDHSDRDLDALLSRLGLQKKAA